MALSWEPLEDALESEDSDRINEAIDEIEALDADERARFFDASFDDLTALYAGSDDGYVRQSIVRVAEQLVPGLAVTVDLTDDPSASDDIERLRNRIDAVCGLLLEAITDDDGRVRQSAERGLQEIFRTYDALGDTETLEALVAELDDMADEYSGKRREQLLDVKGDAEFNLESGYGQLFDGVREELDQDQDPDS